MDPKLAILGVYAAFAVLELAMGRFFFKGKAQASDVWTEVVMTLTFPLLVVPFIFYSAAFLLDHFVPAAQGSIAQWPSALLFLMFVVGDDLLQYWWHRLAHSFPALYSLHRAHHEAPYMSVRLVYRNSLIYYIVLPGLWISAALVHMGAGAEYAVYLSIKMTVIIAAHSSLPWDKPFYAHPLGAKLMWLVERVISTPSTHAAHHGKHLADGVTHYKGNFGNLLFLWDVLFGTAKITRRFPADYGIENLKTVPWYQLVFTPFKRPEPEDA